MIRFILLQNRSGKTRLSKWYQAFTEDEREKIKTEIHRAITARESRYTNFIEWRKYKVVYRRYAGLYFSFCVDMNDNDLAYFENIHLLVEVLDHYFGNVCELDLVFNFHKVYMVIDELFLAGEVHETSKVRVLRRLQEIEQLD
ncbi:AP-2 complex subunit sigma [Diplonema papillatum]|nr:AP-2 complex subunit sigma [Diplonema papillatum]